MVADARSIEAMGALPLAVVTAITVQSGRGVRSFSPVSPASVAQQLGELLDHLPVAAIKIGQVPSAAVARSLARILRSRNLPVVLDPVLRASGGGSLVSGSAPAAIAGSLFPLARLVTVNLTEAAALAGTRVKDISGMRRAASRLESFGARAVLVKGGHLRTQPVDLLRADGEEILFRGTRIAGEMHGTGCALASAAAARLAFGDDLEEAVRRARDHVRALLRRAVQVGARRLRAPGST